MVKEAACQSRVQTHQSSSSFRRDRGSHLQLLQHRSASASQSAVCVERRRRGQGDSWLSEATSRRSQTKKSWTTENLRTGSEASRGSGTTSRENPTRYKLHVCGTTEEELQTRSWYLNMISFSLQVLCVKNLSPQASVAQLVALFSRFEQENGLPVVYRLLTGRMKGQAFITLPGERRWRDPADQSRNKLWTSWFKVFLFPVGRRWNGPESLAAGPWIPVARETFGGWVWPWATGRRETEEGGEEEVTSVCSWQQRCK